MMNFDSLECTIDQSKTFGLKIIVESETPEREAGRVFLLGMRKGPPLHTHRNQLERFTVHEGKLRIILKDRTFDLKPGEHFEFGRDVPHTYENAQDTICVFSYELVPGGGFTEMMRDISSLEKIPRLGKIGVMLRVSEIVDRYRFHVRSVNPPQIVLSIVAWLSRRSH